MRFLAILLILPQLLSASRAAQSRMEADLILKSVTLHIGDSKADAVAIVGNQIRQIGPSSEIAKLAGPKTRIIDGHKKLLLPGFNDSHVHFLDGGFGLARIDLRDSNSPAEFTERIRKYAANNPTNRWILGGNWDHERWPGAPLPTRQMIDAATTTVPVFINRLDGHMAVANTIALQRGGVTRDTKDPDGGTIVRDANGEPTGVLKDAAMSFVDQIIPAPSREEKLTATCAATDYAASIGVTSVTDMSANEDVAIYQTLLNSGELKTRIYAISPIARWNDLAKIGVLSAFGSGMLRIGGLKGFADGSLGSTTALFFEPYNDAPETRGLPGDQMFPEGAMLKRVLGADAAGLQIMIHAIGDKANDEILTIFETAAKQNTAHDRRFRIEHAQHLRPQDIPRFAKAGVIASMQPYHCIDDGRWAEKRIGAERCKTTYAFRTLLDSGATLAFGSDWPVAPLNPMTGVYAAVTRATLDGKHSGGWIPEQKITLEETLRAYTHGSAFAEFQEKNKGAIALDQFADLVLLDQNLFQIPPTQIQNVKVLLTIVDGRVVFEAKP